VKRPSELPSYLYFWYQCHQNAFLSIFPLSSGTEKNHWELDPIERVFQNNYLFTLRLFLHTPSSCQDLQLRSFPNCFSVDIHLLAYSWQSTIFTHNLTNFCNVFFNSARCWLSCDLSSSVTLSLPSEKCFIHLAAVFFIALSL